MSKKFVCPRSQAEGRPFEAVWRKEGTCSYDGSVHPDKFMEYVRAGKLVGTTDKGYKFYVSEWDSPVAGAHKFYTHHLSHEQGWEFWKLWNENKINFGEYPPYVPLFLPGPSHQPVAQSVTLGEVNNGNDNA